MEPALQGRDDVGTMARVGNLKRPQWSPPFRGGMTYASTASPTILTQPQWSPPFRGGMTRSATLMT